MPPRYHVLEQPFGPKAHAEATDPAGCRQGQPPVVCTAHRGEPYASRRAGHNGPVPLYRDEAVVLRTHKLGEADRIITVLTRTRGLIQIGFLQAAAYVEQALRQQALFLNTHARNLTSWSHQRVAHVHRSIRGGAQDFSDPKPTPALSRHGSGNDQNAAHRVAARIAEVDDSP